MATKATYKRLGDYIRLVDVRNQDLKVENLMGINIDKFFMPSVANVIGTDLSNYKIVSPNQFACNLMHVGRDEKIPMAMLSKHSSQIIVSPAYLVFEVNNEDNLMPQYLMMWFRRTEFDRNAWFYTDADVRGGLDKDSLLDMTLPIPPIEEQRKTVAEYQALVKRIEINNQLIAKLEDTAQAIYRNMFVDGIDKENLPEGWKMGTIEDICEVNTDNLSSKVLKDNTIYYLDSGNVTENKFDNIQLLDLQKDEIPSRAKRLVKYNDIVYSTVRPNLKHYGIIKGMCDNLVVSTAFAVIRSISEFISNELLYIMLIESKNTDNLQGIAEMSKATYPSITPEDIMKIAIIIPNASASRLNSFLQSCFNYLYLINRDTKIITELQSLLLAKMGQ